jgi:hypothetical protein
MTERNREKSLGPAGALALLAKTEKTKQASKVLSRESSEIDWELRSEESRTKSHEQLTPEAHMNFSMENPPFFVWLETKNYSWHKYSNKYKMKLEKSQIASSL